MKRLILSRKGFDAKSGGNASPILKDGRIFSLPIPQKHFSPVKYKNLNFDGIPVSELLRETRSLVLPSDYCHHDPMLNVKIGIFGQAGSSQTELKKNKVNKGDLFLFFGWFKDFFNNGNDIHHLFGWLQIEQIIDNTIRIKKFLKALNIKHPHGYDDENRYKNNTIYVGKKMLALPKMKSLSISGFGLFKNYHKDLTLTELDMSRSRWKLPKRYFLNSKNLFLNRLKWDDEKECKIFYKGFGQEFILNSEENPKLIDWAYFLINNYGKKK